MTAGAGRTVKIKIKNNISVQHYKSPMACEN